MSTIVAQATGNFSATSTWTGGVVPGAGDTAQTGAYTVTIDTDVTCDKLEATSTGHFLVSASGKTITADIESSGSYTGGALRCEHSSGMVTVVGNVKGGTASGVLGINIVNNGDLTVTGNVNGGTALTTNGIKNNGSGRIVINGNLTGGDGQVASAVYNNSTGIIIVTGNVVGGSYRPSGVGSNGVQNYDSGVIIVHGDVAGGGYNSCRGISNASNGIVLIYGNVYGGWDSYAYGVYNYGSGTVAIHGDLVGNASSATEGVYNNGTGTIAVSGSIIGGIYAASLGAYNKSTGLIQAESIIGGSAANAYGVHNASTGQVLCNMAAGGSGSDAHGVYNETTGVVTITGAKIDGSCSNAKGVYQASTASTVMSNLTAGDIADAVLDELVTEHTTTNSAGQKLGLINASSVTTVSYINGSTIIFQRAVTFDETISNLTIDSTWSVMYFTVKAASDLPDTNDDDAVIQIKVTNGGAAGDGLLRIQGGAATASNGSLTVDASAGTVEVIIEDDATQSLVSATGLSWDLKIIKSTGRSEILTKGNATVIDAVTITV